MTQEFQPGTAMAQLRHATRAHHERAEHVPLMQALAEGSLARDDYVRYLRMLAVIHAALERKLATSDCPAVAAVWREEMRRMPFLERDLRALEARRVPDGRRATEEVLVLADHIQLEAAQNPVGLLGFLYVLEGSRNGSARLADRVGACLGIDAASGLAYLVSAGEDRREQWAGFVSRMNEAVVNDRDRRRAVEAAGRMFDRITRIFDALFPLKPSGATFFATTINPEAGRHPVPDDPRELEAVFRAARRCWDAFPYYSRRYGERGMRFADSDCAWLAALESLTAEKVEAQVAWLGSVLSSRGMPTLLLEMQLRMLHEELTAAVPEAAERHDMLLSAADALARRRGAVLPSQKARELASRFDRLPDSDAGPAGMGEVLVAAVCDEQAGMDEAVSSILEWASSAGRCPQGWLEAARTTIERARQDVGGHQEQVSS